MALDPGRLDATAEGGPGSEARVTARWRHPVVRATPCNRSRARDVLGATHEPRVGPFEPGKQDAPVPGQLSGAFRTPVNQPVDHHLLMDYKSFDFSALGSADGLARDLL